MTDDRLNWLKVTVHHPPLTADAVSAAMFEEGAGSVWEDKPDAEGREVLRAAFQVEQLEALKNNLPEYLAAIAEAFEIKVSDFALNFEVEKDHNWAEKWKEGLSPISVSPALAVVPTWWPEDDLPKAGRLLRIDPGLAFGSGHHATTFMCLAFLDELAPKAERILDVGAGSGILSLAAAALNPEAVVMGVDNDPDTIEVARENAELNQLLHRLDFSDKDLSELKPPFDLIVANITLEPLKGLASGISALAPDGGHLILSGLLAEQVDEALGVYQNLGWGLYRHIGRDEWSALALVKGRARAEAPREAV